MAGKSRRPIVYSLSLAVYCTSWTYYGSVGLSAASGYNFLPVYIGPILLFLVCWPLLRRIVLLSKRHNITSIADFIAARYGKSQRLAAAVTVIAVIGIMPYTALAAQSGVDQLRGADRSTRRARFRRWPTGRARRRGPSSACRCCWRRSRSCSARAAFRRPSIMMG